MSSQKNLVENPSTAVASDSEGEAHLQSQKATPTHKKRKRKKDKKFEPKFDIPGVHRVVLQDVTQQAINCVVGEEVTVEKPWFNVDKDLIVDQIEASGESSEFFPLQQEIRDFPDPEILVGYIPDESKDYDEFYVCVTQEATEAVKEIVERFRKLQEEKLKNAVHKKIKRWKPLGSDKEVEEAMTKYHRSLIEVEIESKYPILPFKVQFRLIKAQDLRDGYMELRPSDSLSTIYRRRIDAGIQVTPKVVSNEAQTVCTYPKNSFTQYEYDLPYVSFESSEKQFKEFINENIDSFCDILRVNGTIDLYSNDYENLVRDQKHILKIVLPEPKEYFCFVDMNLCGNKMISNVTWHPMWTGCLILSYVDTAPSLYLKSKVTTDQVFGAIHGSNPVLFWSFTDDLKPKLILETPRPVYTLSCCPHDPNLIIGGCVNGQIILWDITNKLYYVEEEEILNVDQQKYREYMFSLMNWMKNIFDLTLVRPTALSQLQHSHKDCVNSISWMSPFHRISKTGKVEEVGEANPHSLQLFTSSEDGTILIWDLRMKPASEPGGFKVRKMKRLKKKPSALLVMESPFKILHLNLRPIYKIKLPNPVDAGRIISISSCYINFFKPSYEQARRDSIRTMKLSDRLIFQPVLKSQEASTRKTFFAGTMNGCFMQGTWDGQEFDSGELVNFEEANYVHWGKYHDGPVVSVDRGPFNDTILTVGGKVFALWRETFPGKPILWRKGTAIYTYGSWLEFEKYSVLLTRIDGYQEIWTLFYQSKSPLNVRLMSNGAINHLSIHPRKIKNVVWALSDYRGSLRLFCTKNPNPLIVQSREESMSLFLTKEIERKKAFLEWQEMWSQKHQASEKVVEEKQPSEVIEVTETKKKEEKKKVVTISPGERYMQAVQEQHQRSEQARIKNIILMKKQLDTEDLLKKREPLRKLEEENEVKRRKQRNKLKEADQIFIQQVEMLFPDVVKSKPPPPPDPYQDYSSEETKEENFSDYDSIANEAETYVDEHPFSYDFSWGTVLKMGRERRKKLDDLLDKSNHKNRYEMVKKEKEIAQKLAEVPEGTGSVRQSLMDETSVVSSIND